MRLDRLQYGPLYLTSVAFANFPKEAMAWFEKRAGVATVGLLGAQALQNYRVGLDYAHSTVYFEIGRTFNFPDFDVIGLILRPEDDGKFSILGVADYDGKTSVPGVSAGDLLVAVDGIPVRGTTLGQVWSMLGGTPDKERTLTIERGGKEFAVTAKVRHFLGEPPDPDEQNEKSKKH
jgi:S1-C subfamily serine protease